MSILYSFPIKNVGKFMVGYVYGLLEKFLKYFRFQLVIEKKGVKSHDRSIFKNQSGSANDCQRVCHARRFNIYCLL